MYHKPLLSDTINHRMRGKGRYFLHWMIFHERYYANNNYTNEYKNNGSN